MTPQGESVQLHFLAPDLASAALARADCRAWLEDGLAYSDVGLAAEDVIARLAGGEYRALLVRIEAHPAALVVLEIAHAGNPSKKTLSVIAAGGERMHSWLGDVQRAMREIAAVQNCERVVVIGRPGWERALRNFGWKKTGVVMEVAPKRYQDS